MHHCTCWKCQTFTQTISPEIFRDDYYFMLTNEDISKNEIFQIQIENAEYEFTCTYF